MLVFRIVYPNLWFVNPVLFASFLLMAHLSSSMQWNSVNDITFITSHSFYSCHFELRLHFLITSLFGAVVK